MVSIVRDKVKTGKLVIKDVAANSCKEVRRSRGRPLCLFQSPFAAYCVGHYTYSMWPTLISSNCFPFTYCSL